LLRIDGDYVGKGRDFDSTSIEAEMRSAGLCLWGRGSSRHIMKEALINSNRDTLPLMPRSKKEFSLDSPRVILREFRQGILSASEKGILQS
jgi:hypothetical protein